MSRRLVVPNRSGGTTDHAPEIAALRSRGAGLAPFDPAQCEVDYLAASLLEGHDETGGILDNWVEARNVVERRLGLFDVHGLRFTSHDPRNQ